MSTTVTTIKAVYRELRAAVLAPFQGAQHFTVESRLRYRLENRQVAFHYELINPHLLIKAVADQVLAQIKAETQLEPLFGSFQPAS